MKLRWLAAAVAASCALLAACGDDGDPAGEHPATTAPAAQRLTAAERSFLSDAEASIVDYCRRRALSLTDPDRRPTVRQQAEAFRAIDDLVALAGEKPRARVRRGVDVSLFLGDLTENLEGANCDPQILARLREGLATLPRPGVSP